MISPCRPVCTGAAVPTTGEFNSLASALDIKSPVRCASPFVVTGLMYRYLLASLGFRAHPRMSDVGKGLSAVDDVLCCIRVFSINAACIVLPCIMKVTSCSAQFTLSYSQQVVLRWLR